LYLFVRTINNLKIDRSFLIHPITLILIVDLIWLLVTSCTSTLPEVSFKRLIMRFVYDISFYVFFFELYRLGREKMLKVFSLQCFGLMVPVILSFKFHAIYGFTASAAVAAARPFYSDHTIFGAVIVFLIPFLCFMAARKEHGFRQKVFWRMLVALFIVTAYFTFSRAALASLFIAGLIFVLLYYQVKARFVILGLLGIALITFFIKKDISEYILRNKEVSKKEDVSMHFKSISNVKTDVSNAERINRWKCAYRMFLDKPLFGFGPGTYQFEYGKYQQRSEMTVISTFNGTRGHAHSEYLGYLSETGLVGFVNFILLLVVACSRAIKIIYGTKEKELKHTVLFVFTGLLTFFIHGTFNGFIETDKMALPVFSSLAALVFLDIQYRSERSKSAAAS
jgi:putative inorganic carbon (hco3(-)) transporter